MKTWFGYALCAAVLYGLHQVFTKMAAHKIGDGLGGFIVEITAAITILVYLGILWGTGSWNQEFNVSGGVYSILTGICVGLGTIFFFLLFQKGGPLTAVPAILAVGSVIMVLSGFFFFKEPFNFSRFIGTVLSIAGLYLLR